MLPSHFFSENNMSQVEKHKLTFYYLGHIAMASVQVGKALNTNKLNKYEEPTPLNKLRRDEKRRQVAQ